MPKTAVELKAQAVAKLRYTGQSGKGATYHAVGGVRGLLLCCKPPRKEGKTIGGRSWVLRMMINGKRRDMGLGSYPETSISEARKEAKRIRKKIEKKKRKGKLYDPIAEKQKQESALRKRQALQKTFGEVAEMYIAREVASGRTPKTIQRINQQFDQYILPLIENQLVADIDVPTVLSVLKQPVEKNGAEEMLWVAYPDLAKRVRQRIANVMTIAIQSTYYENANPAEKLNSLLPKQPKKFHEPALPHEQVTGFYKHVCSHGGVSARALQLQLLTNTRSKEVCMAKWSDIHDGLWTIDATDMKMRRGHKIPLSKEAQRLLGRLPRDSEWVFPNTKGGHIHQNYPSDFMRKVLHKEKLAQDGVGYIDPEQIDPNTGEKLRAVPHGFRATFRTWSMECTNYSEDARERQLSHVEEDNTKKAYKRSHMLEERRELVEDWADYLMNGRPEGKVVPIRGRA